METPILTVAELIRMLERTISRAVTPDARFAWETDAVLRGKIQALALIGDGALPELQGDEHSALTAAIATADATIADLKVA